MRLAQMARKLAVRPSEIIAFLASHNIVVDEKSNTRLLDEHVLLIREHYGDVDNAKEEEVVSVITPEPINAETILPEEVVLPEADEVPGESQPDVIKAPRVELSGLKVLGKIDLPEPKKKEPEASANIHGEAPPEVKRNVSRRPPRSEQRPVKNQIALQRERDKAEKDKQRQERAEFEKEQRTKKYQSRIKAAPPTKRVKLVEEHVEVITDDQKPEPKTWVGRFFRWLKT